MEVRRGLEARHGIEERLDLYRRPEVRGMLYRMLSKGDAEFDVSTSTLLGSKDQALAEGMEKAGILVRSSSGSIVKDPATGRSMFMVELVCPYCKSSSITREEMLEHRDCGFIGRLSEFTVRGNRLYCPRCGRPATKTSIRRIGIWFRCRRCGQTFHKPEVAIYDPERRSAVPLEQLEIVDRIRYEINPELREEIRPILDLYSTMESRLSSMGFSLEPLGSIKGISGVTHEFDIMIHAEQVSLGIDVLICEDQERLLQSLLRLVTKYFDLMGMGVRVLLAVAPRPPSAARSMISSTNLGNLIMAEADSISGLMKETEAKLTRLSPSTM